MITIDYNSRFIAVSKPKVISLNHFTFFKGNTKVGKIDATFDFSNLNPSFHEIALQNIISNRCSFQYPSLRLTKPVVFKENKRWWQKYFNSK